MPVRTHLCAAENHSAAAPSPGGHKHNAAGVAKSKHQHFKTRLPPLPQVQLEPIRRVSGGAAGQLAPKYTGMLQAVRTIVREEGVLVSFCWMLSHSTKCPHLERSRPD